MLDRGADHRVAGGFVGDIDRHGHGLGAGCNKLGHGGVTFNGVPRGHDDLRTGRGHPLGHAQPNAAISARDQRYSPAQIKLVHAFDFLKRALEWHHVLWIN